jgi:hypothetical protein
VGRSFEEAFEIGDFKPLLPVIYLGVGKLAALVKIEQNRREILRYFAASS